MAVMHFYVVLFHKSFRFVNRLRHQGLRGGGGGISAGELVPFVG